MIDAITVTVIIGLCLITLYAALGMLGTLLRGLRPPSAFRPEYGAFRPRLRRLLIRLEFIRLYRVECGGGAEWVSATSVNQAARFWHEWAAKAGLPCAWSTARITWDDDQWLGAQLRTDLTILDAMAAGPSPRLIGTAL